MITFYNFSIALYHFIFRSILDHFARLFFVVFFLECFKMHFQYFTTSSLVTQSNMLNRLELWHSMFSLLLLASKMVCTCIFCTFFYFGYHLITQFMCVNYLLVCLMQWSQFLNLFLYMILRWYFENKFFLALQNSDLKSSNSKLSFYRTLEIFLVIKWKHILLNYKKYL